MKKVEFYDQEISSAFVLPEIEKLQFLFENPFLATFERVELA